MSNDLPVGNPFNIAQYALLAHMVAHITGHVAEKLVVTMNDAHIYEDQIEKVKEQLSREPIDIKPAVSFGEGIKEINDFKFDNIHIHGYGPGSYHPNIDYPVAV